MPLAGLNYPLTNGVRHSWASCSFEFGGVTYSLVEVNYAPKLDAQYVRGSGPNPIATTTGMSSMTADATMLEEEFLQFMTTLGAPGLTLAGGAGFMTSFCDFTITKSNEGYIESGLSTIVDTFKARITEVSAAMSSSSGDALVRKMTLLPLTMQLNGTSPFPNMPSLSLGGVAGQGIGIARRLIGI